MHINFCVEEPSAEKLLKNILPKIVGNSIDYSVLVFQGKHDLLKNLPGIFRAYKSVKHKKYSFVVLIDNDSTDCKTTKSRLEKIAAENKLLTKSVDKESFLVLNRVAMEEIESWLLGDFEALINAYPRVKDLSRKAGYRVPDSIRNTAERLENLLKRFGYYPSGMPKIEVAQKVSEFMDPARNKSKSFQMFRDGLLSLISQS